jgi:hypothetical protein
MSLFQRGDVWWYEFWFAGRRIRESSKTAAKNAEQKHKRELEQGFNNFADLRQERIRTFSDFAEEYFDVYKLRLPQSARFAEYAVDHLKRILGGKMLVDFNEAAVIHYQNAHPRRSGRPAPHPAPQEKDAQAKGPYNSRKSLHASGKGSDAGGGPQGELSAHLSCVDAGAQCRPPIAVQQKMMRHTDIRTTMNIYGDVVTDEMSTAGLRVAELAFQRNGT